MGEQLFFKILDDVEVMVKLVNAVPDSWGWLDGQLCAPAELNTNGKAERDTGFAIQRFHSIGPTIIGAYNRESGKRLKPNLYAIIAEQKLPGFIDFNEAGYEYEISLELAKRFAVAFLNKGYRGGLRFYLDCYRNSKYSNPAECSMALVSWYGASFGDEIGEQPARVKLEWDERYGGKKEDITPILTVCQSLGLRRYEPIKP